MDLEAEARSESDAAARRREAEKEVDELLGPRALIPIGDMQRYGGPSPQTLHRAERAGKIELVRNGQRTSLTRALAKFILIDGLGPIDFLYGQQGERKRERRARKVA
jgi:hypothetical protein